MPVALPQTSWPSDLQEDGPPEDPAILLAGAAKIGAAPYRLLAVRLDPLTLAVNYRADLQEEVYADYRLEDLMDELTFLEDIDKTVLVPMAGGHYVIWMMPFSGAERDP